jgi:uncharacterized protein (DUF305 family)
MTRKRIGAILAAMATAVFLSACGNGATSTDGHTDHEHTSEAPVISGAPAGFDNDDVLFAKNMIPHHEQAVALSALAPTRSASPELIALAQQISVAQAPEIDTFKAFLVQWQENPADGTGHAEHGDMNMAGMVDDDTMAKLASLTGAPFDQLWLTSMIGHHRGAIAMAKAEAENGVNVDAKALAQTIITTQQAEIDQMEKMVAAKP